MLFGVFSVLSNTAPQASPKFSPSRLLSYGRHGRELRDRKDRKPLVMTKRQMTWFRGMERRGFTIHWLDACLPMEDKVEKIINLLHTKN